MLARSLEDFSAGLARTEAPPPLDADAQAAFIAKSKALAPEYKTELLPPPGAK